MATEKGVVTHIDRAATFSITNEVATDAQDSVAIEHSLTPWQAIKAYPMAVFWCFVVSTCVVMEGYDQILIGSLFAYPSFQVKYGTFVGVTNTTRSGYQLSAAWQAGLSNGSTVGAFFGTLLNG